MSGAERSGAERSDADAADLIAEIGREAEEQRQRILAEARERAASLLAAAEAEIAAETARAEALMEKRARIDAERLLGEVTLEAAAARLRMRRQAYDEAIGEARKKLADLARGPDWKSALRSLFTEALAGVEADAEVLVRVTDSDKAAAAALLKELGRKGGVEAVDGAPGTLIVAAKDGRRKIDNGLGARLDQAAESREAAIAARLFAEE